MSEISYLSAGAEKNFPTEKENLGDALPGLGVNF